jgi:formylmethanofuran dehydrogenase subunit E
MSETRDQEKQESFDLLAEKRGFTCQHCGEQIRFADKEAFNAKKLCSRCYRKLELE